MIQANSTAYYKTILVLFFFSGLAALIYEVLWMKELGLLFGNTAHATATTLTAFFLGLALGGYYWGQRAAKLENPLQTYGLLELATAISVVGYFLMLDGYFALYPAMFGKFESAEWLFTLVKFALAIAVLFPPAFFLGGTLPVISQYIVRGTRNLGLQVSILYGLNTLGAAIGALLAGFYLPKTFGYRISYQIAMACTICVGCVALKIANRIPAETARPIDAAPVKPKTQVSPLIPMRIIKALAFVSGFGTICLQVLWTRMMAQVLQNSVYTFSSIVIVFLLFLAIGAGLSYYIIRRVNSQFSGLFVLLFGAGMAVALTPFVFNYWTDGLRYIGAQVGWCSYLAEVFQLEIGIMALPLIILGAVFPYLLKIAEPCETSSGQLVGQLVAWNTAGAIAGSLVGGFVLLDTLGVSASIRFVAVIYLLAGLYVVNLYDRRDDSKFAAICIGILLIVSVFDTSRLPVVRVDPVTNHESLLEVWESSSGTVAVIRREDALKIKVNNYYTLGGTGSRELEELEGYLPVQLRQRTESVFFLGMGTGISAGAVLRFPVRQLQVAELIPDVVEASKKYFGRFNNRLFFDPRAQVIKTDGRNYLAATSNQYDIIIADLFVPWRSGTGSLYSLEHYQSVGKRMYQNGLFMQWLPAYQLSRFELLTIARTLSEVFPQITLWRGDFSARKPIIGLLGQLAQTPLAPNALIFNRTNKSESGDRVPVLAHYIGNLRGLTRELQSCPINQDDKPVIEYQAPVTQRLQKIKQAQWIVGEQLIQLMERIQIEQPLELDPYLSQLEPEQRDIPKAGMHLHRAQVLKQGGHLTAAKKAYSDYKNTLNPTKK